MTVYVDDAMIAWNPSRAPGHVWRMCHMFADTDAELHAFAAKIGLKRAWHQCPPKASWSHYDVTATKRAAALKAGAVAIGKREVLLKWREISLARLSASEQVRIWEHERKQMRSAALGKTSNV